MQKLRALLYRLKLRELIAYGIVGVLTTAVNYVMYAGVSRGAAALLGVAPDHAAMILAAKIVAWIAAVAFAFWANKKYVFMSADWSLSTLRHELPSFVSARILSLLFDVAFVEITVHLLGMNDLIATLIANIIVIVLNYFASKLWIFKKR